MISWLLFIRHSWNCINFDLGFHVSVCLRRLRRSWKHIQGTLQGFHITWLVYTTLKSRFDFSVSYDKNRSD